MISKAETVDAYLEEIPLERHDALRRIRELCLEHLPGFAESMQYGMPSYSRDGVVEVAFASQRNNISFYVLRTAVLDEYRDKFATSQIGKGCIRYANPSKIDFAMVAEMLKKTVTDTGEVC